MSGIMAEETGVDNIVLHVHLVRFRQDYLADLVYPVILSN